jgi:hypothetical protein
MPIVLKGFVLGLIIFTVDLIAYTICSFTSLNKIERQELVSKLKYTIPIGLFMQVFFALIFLFTFRFLAIFKALEQDVGGGLYFAYILFLPLLYMQFNNWLWMDTKRITTFLNITAWGLKLAICGVFVALL